MSEKEKSLLDNKVKSSGLKFTDYLIKTLSEKTIISISNGNEILLELKRQGNNLNQTIKNCYFGHIIENELLSAVAECKKIYSLLLSSIGGS